VDETPWSALAPCPAGVSAEVNSIRSATSRGFDADAQALVPARLEQAHQRSERALNARPDFAATSSGVNCGALWKSGLSEYITDLD